MTDSVATSLAKGRSEHHLAEVSRRRRDRNYRARRIVAGKVDETSVTEWAAVARAHAQIAQAAALQALVRNNELLVHELRRLNSREDLPSTGTVAF